MNVMLRQLPLDKINPYDQVHRESGNGFMCLDEYDNKGHHEGIAYVRQLLKEGKDIRPIVVMPMTLSPFKYVYPDKQYHRLDGFKRFMAHQLEGLTYIWCLVVDKYVPGAQHGHPMEVVEEAEWATFTTSSHKPI